MCVVCGCANTDAKPRAADGLPYVRVQRHGYLQELGHHHHHHHHHPELPPAILSATSSATSPASAHVHVDATTGDLHYGAGSAKVSVPGMSQQRAIRIEQDVLGANKRLAIGNRADFANHGILALNLVSSPGSGKTTLLCATIEALRQRHADLPVAVIEGDQQTSHDADRIRATGAPAIQVNTGRGCHLDAQMVADAFARLRLQPSPDPGPGAILFIENVGNLVCPAMWDLGEAAKVVILSVTEGEDKPLKYPDMFAAADLMILNKTDLLPHLRFDVQRCLDYARQVNPSIRVLQLSAVDGQGMAAWLDWIDAARPAQAALHTRIAELEAQLQDLRAQLPGYSEQPQQAQQPRQPQRAPA